MNPTDDTPATGGAAPATCVKAPLLTLFAAALLWCAFPSASRADGSGGPPPQAPPPQLPADADDEDDAPRRDFRMGTRDNMSMGRDKEGNLLMEVSPRPRKPQDTPNMPLYVYPQVYTGYGPSSGQGAGQGGQVMPGGQPDGQSGGQPGGQSGGQTAPPPAHSPQGAGPKGVIPAPPGPSRGAPPGQ